MTELFNPPSIDPAQRDTVMGTIQFIVDKLVMQVLDKMMPCKVVAVDRTKNRVSVQIMISMVNTAGQNVIRSQIASVPIYSASAGGYVINFPVQAGDFGWIKATDTDMSLFLQTLQQSPPNTKLTHDFASSSYWPDNMNHGVTIAGGDASKLVIQNYTGTVKATFSGSEIDLVAPTQINVTAPTVTIAASTAINLNTPVVNVSGNISQAAGGGATATFSGSITATGNITGSGTSLHTHVHSGVTVGSGNTGAPV